MCVCVWQLHERGPRDELHELQYVDSGSPATSLASTVASARAGAGTASRAGTGTASDAGIASHAATVAASHLHTCSRIGWELCARTMPIGMWRLQRGLPQSPSAYTQPASAALSGTLSATICKSTATICKSTATICKSIATSAYGRVVPLLLFLILVLGL